MAQDQTSLADLDLHCFPFSPFLIMHIIHACMFSQCKATIGSAEAMLPGRTPEEIQELLQKWRPPDWLTEVIARKQPYFPQMGDELMYFRQGHELYAKAVHRRSTYPIDLNKNQPWHKNLHLRVSSSVYTVRFC